MSDRISNELKDYAGMTASLGRSVNIGTFEKFTKKGKAKSVLKHYLNAIYQLANRGRIGLMKLRLEEIAKPY